MIQIESLLSARLFLAPQSANGRLYFVSNLNGRLSLYACQAGGSIPEPLLPPHIALQNPQLMEGSLYSLYPDLGKILVMIDQNGDEQYKPMVIPLSGDFPQPIFEETFAGYKVNLIDAVPEENRAYFWAQSNTEPISKAYRADLATGELTYLWQSPYGGLPSGASKDGRLVLLIEAYGSGDHVAYLWQEEQTGEPTLLYGTPISQRQEGQEYPINSIVNAHFIRNNRGFICFTALFSDSYGLAYLDLETKALQEVPITGLVHTGAGEFMGIQHLQGNRYALHYNIDGCSWLYEAALDETALTIAVTAVLVGQAPLSDGVLKGNFYDKATDEHVVSFTTAVSPTQLITLSGPNWQKYTYHTQEKVLGIPQAWLSLGEDASFTSHDGLRISARLYLPAPELGFAGQRPLVYYIHGGPQGQEHPDFAWFSMPLIQFLTLQGFAVFVPNVRGSTGYGHAYMNRVTRDWGGQDRLDHVHAMTHILPQDPRLDTKRAGVIGRSYGGFMTLTLASRHPELWAAAVDMFGPYNFNSFVDRVPETWKPMLTFLVGDPVKNPDYFIERSPSTHIHRIQCPLLVIQGKNDPRVWEIESRELVENLRQQGKEVDYLMFEDEGHDVLKYENRVRCYNAITDFFKQHLA